MRIVCVLLLLRSFTAFSHLNVINFYLLIKFNIFLSK